MIVSGMPTENGVASSNDSTTRRSARGDSSLRRADLWRATLRYAEVAGADFAGAKLHDALFPRSFSSFATADLQQWPTGDFLSQRPRDVHGLVLNGWLGMIARARKLNDIKAQLVRVALIALAVALALTAGTAGIIAP